MAINFPNNPIVGERIKLGLSYYKWNGDSTNSVYQYTLTTPWYFNTLSDINFKENFKNIEDSIEILNMIKTYAFDYKDSGVKSYGVIAQELEKILPELVKENENGWKTVSYIPLIAILINAVNELNNKIESI